MKNICQIIIFVLICVSCSQKQESPAIISSGEILNKEIPVDSGIVDLLPADIQLIGSTNTDLEKDTGFHIVNYDIKNISASVGRIRANISYVPGIEINYNTTCVKHNTFSVIQPNSICRISFIVDTNNLTVGLYSQNIILQDNKFENIFNYQHYINIFRKNEDQLSVPGIACKTGYHLERRSCLLDIKPCSLLPENALSGTQKWQNGSYSSCEVSVCKQSFKIYNNECISLQRACLSQPNNSVGGNENIINQIVGEKIIGTDLIYSSCQGFVCDSSSYISENGLSCQLIQDEPASINIAYEIASNPKSIDSSSMIVPVIENLTLNPVETTVNETPLPIVYNSNNIISSIIPKTNNSTVYNNNFYKNTDVLTYTSTNPSVNINSVYTDVLNNLVYNGQTIGIQYSIDYFLPVKRYRFKQISTLSDYSMLSNLSLIGEYNSKYYFFATDRTKPYQLMALDSQDQITQVTQNVESFSSTFGPKIPSVNLMGNKMYYDYFDVNTAKRNNYVLDSNGIITKSTSSKIEIINHIVHNSSLYFSERSPDVPPSGKYKVVLYKKDASGNIKTIFNEISDVNARVSNFVVYNQNIYFNYEYILYRIKPDDTVEKFNNTVSGGSIVPQIVYNNELYVIVNNDKLYKINNQDQITLVSNTEPTSASVRDEIGYLMMHRNELYYTSRFAFNSGKDQYGYRDIYKINSQGQVINVSNFGYIFGTPTNLTSCGLNLYYVLKDYTKDTSAIPRDSLWKIKIDGTHQLLSSGQLYSMSQLTCYKNEIFFVASKLKSGSGPYNQYYKTNQNSISQITNFADNVIASGHERLFVFNDKLYVFILNKGFFSIE